MNSRNKKQKPEISSLEVKPDDEDIINTREPDSNDHDDSDEHEEHIDERWLVSYADMMTLLFGLFVLLYSMKSPEEIKKMQESIQQKFSQVEAPPKPEDISASLNEKITALESENKIFKDNNVNLSDEAARLKDEISELKKQMTALALKAQQKPRQKYFNPKKDNAVALKEKNKTLTDENTSLKAELSSLQMKMTTSLENLKNEQKRQVASVETQNQELEKQKAIVNEKEKTLNEKEKTINEKEKTIYELKMKNEELQNRISSVKNFLAIIVSWSTPDHDIDVSITDPGGHVFDFKRRTYKGVPGSFALDTRRGPGTEVWQTEDLVPGNYKALIKFYSQYGNTQNPKVKVTVFSTRGKLEIPEFEMNFKTSRNQTILFAVDNDGHVKIK